MPVTINGSNTPTAGGVTYGDGTQYATTAAGTSGQVLQSNGASAPSWVAAPTTSPAGSTGQVQYNNAGAFGAISSGTSGQLLTSAGAGAAPTWTTVASGLSGASQADMEAGSSTSVAVTPGVAQYHPSASKCWIKCSTSAVQASYNITSITSLGTGSVRVTINVDFSSANYAISATPLASGGTTVMTLNIFNQAAGTFEMNTYESFTGSATNPVSFFASCFGDQP